MSKKLVVNLTDLANKRNFLYTHNRQPYYKLVKSFKEGNKRAAIVHAVGTGKSYIAMQWLQDEITGASVLSDNASDPILDVEPSDANVLYVAPKLAAFGQIQRHLLSLGADDLLNRITFITYSKLLYLFTKHNGRFSIEDVKAVEDDFEDEELSFTDADWDGFAQAVGKFTHIVLDEFHHADENKWGYVVKKMLQANPNAKVLGLTATPVRSSGTNTVDSVFNGNVVSTISIADAIASGILPLPEYKTAVYSYAPMFAKYRERIQKLSSYEKKQEALKMLDEIERRVTASKGSAKIIAETFLAHPDGKFVIFCDNIETSKTYIEDILKITKQFNIPVQTVYNVNSSNVNAQIEIENFDQLRGKGLKLLFAVDMINESVHLNGIDGEIMMRNTDSAIVYEHQLGRVFSSGKGNTPVVLDMVNNVFSAYEYKRANEGMIAVFRRVAQTTKDEHLKALALEIIEENKVMEMFKELDSLVGIEFLVENEKLELIKEAIENRDSVKGIAERDGKFIIRNYCVYKGYPIGRYVSYAKSSRIANKTFVEGLKKLNVNLDKLLVVLTSKQKLKLIAEAIKHRTELDGIIEKDGKYIISTNCVYEGYPIGKYVSYTKSNLENDPEFVKGLLHLKVDLEPRKPAIDNKIKLELIKQAIEEKIEGVRFVKGQYYVAASCTYKGYNIGHYVHNVKNGSSNNEEFINGLIALNVNVDVKKERISTDEKLKLIKEAIENNIEGIQKVNGQYEIAYGCQYKGQSIGLFVFYAKTGRSKDKKLVEGLKKLKVSLEMKKTVLKASEKAELIKEAIEHIGEVEGIEEKAGKYYISNNCEYKGYPIGKYVATAKVDGYTDTEFVDLLVGLNVNLDRIIEHFSNEDWIKLLKEAIDNYTEVEGIEFEDGMYVISSKCVYKGKALGSFIGRAKNMPEDSQIVKALNKLKISLEKALERLSTAEKLKLIAEAVKNRDKVDGITEKDGLIYISLRTQYKGYNIGAMVSRAKLRDTTDPEFLKGLKKLNICLEKQFDTLTYDEKVELFDEMFNEIDKVTGVTLTEKGYIIVDSCTYKGYPVGKYVARVKRENYANKRFVNYLISKGVYMGRQKVILSSEEKLKLIKEAIDSKAEGITFKDGKYYIPTRYVYNDYPIGQYISAVKNGDCTDSKFIKGLIEIGVSLPDDILSDLQLKTD